MGLLDGEIQRAVAQAFSGKLLTGTLRKFPLAVSTALDDAGDPLDEPVPVDYTCDAFEESYDEAYRARAGIPEGDVKITIMAGSLPAGVRPEKDDKFLIRGKWYQLRQPSTDPAQATWTVSGYGVADGG